MRVLASLLVVATGCLGSGDSDPTGPEQVGDGSLVAAGLSFGECLGYCTHQLLLDGRDLELRSGSNDGQPENTSAARLTDAGVAAVAALADQLATGSLEDVYGCPDCNDGGDAFLDIIREGDIVFRVHWAADDPAAPVAAADALLIDDLLRNLARCDASANVTPGACTPVW